MHFIKRIIVGLLAFISYATAYATAPQCLVTANAVQSIPANTRTVLAFANVISDTDAIHSSDSQTFTIHTPGVYSIAAFMPTYGPGDKWHTAWLEMEICVNETRKVAIVQVSDACHLNASAIVKLNSGDTIKVYGSSWVEAFNTYYLEGLNVPASLSIVKIDNAGTPQCLVTANAVQSIPANTRTALAYANVISDTDAIHGSDSQTFTIHTPGVYSIAAFMPTYGPGDKWHTAWLEMEICVNETRKVAIVQISDACHLTASAIVKLNSGDTIKVYGSSWAEAFNTYFLEGLSVPTSLSIVKVSD